MSTVQNVARTDAGLASELRVSVMRLRRRLIVEGLPDEALSLTQTSVLACLYRNGDLTVGDLAAFERVQPPSMVVVSLTDHGRDLVRADRARRDAWLSRRLSELSPEQRAVLRQAAPILDDLSRKD